MPYTPVINDIHVTRYLLPFIEGGSMPGLIEGEDGKLYVLKFRGAAQGPKALIAELIGGEIARALGLRVPKISFAQLDNVFAQTEPDHAIQVLMKQSVGQNLAVDYLADAFTYDPAVTMTKLNAKTASQIVWLDSLILNVDRSARNTNMLWWKDKLWIIDHGAALFFQHSWRDWEQRAQKPFTEIKNHVLLPLATQMQEVCAEYSQLLTKDMIRKIVSLVPDEWLPEHPHFATIAEQKEAYVRFFELRLDYSVNFVTDISDAR